MLDDAPVALTDADAPGPPESAPLSYERGKQAAIDAFERAYLPSLLKRHEGNVSAAAAEAGFDRTYLYRLLRKHGLKPK